MTAAERHGRETWMPPASYRDAVESLDHLAGHLVALIDQSDVLVLDTATVEFVARRIQRTARIVHRSLPAEVI